MDLEGQNHENKDWINCRIMLICSILVDSARFGYILQTFDIWNGFNTWLFIVLFVMKLSSLRLNLRNQDDNRMFLIEVAVGYV